ncbi:unnamed protein product [Macrosiphum euphorbiae]|uniref:Uncharacterized protein n=1 Tax=Macrosiphum euphorbiae TaxID=13131 RepID=A0AAV0XE73_9HEMI|nr:unnamed protein product [Macrosiphum euphorbiae]
MARTRRRTQQNAYAETTNDGVRNEPLNDRPGTSEKTNDGLESKRKNNQPVGAGSEIATKKPGVAFLDTVKCEQSRLHYPDIPPTLFPYYYQKPPVSTRYNQKRLPPVLTRINSDTEK